MADKFVFAPIAVFQDGDLTDIERRVLLALMSFRDPKTTRPMFPFRESIARRAGFESVATISRATSSLVKKGWLVKVGNGGRSAPVNYQYRVPDRLLNGDRSGHCLSEETVTDPVTVSALNGDRSGHGQRTNHNSITNRKGGGESSLAISVPEVVALYHQILPAHPQIRKITPERMRLIKARIREDLPDREAWETYFRIVSVSEFLTGKIPPRPESGYSKAFVANLDWLIKPGSVAKVAEKLYH